MTENIDEGPIICSSTINIKNCKDYFDVRVKTYLDSVKLISKAIEIIKKTNLLRNLKKMENTGNQLVKKNWILL